MLSANSPTLLVKASASRKFLNLYSFSRWCSSTTSQSPPNCTATLRSSSPLSGGVPPLQGTHSFSANAFIVHSFFCKLARCPPPVNPPLLDLRINERRLPQKAFPDSLIDAGRERRRCAGPRVV